jgi:hypothetical protein
MNASRAVATSESAPPTESPARELAPLYITAAAMVALTLLGEFAGEALGFGFVFVEPGMFILIGLVGCAIAPDHPLRVAVLGIIGAVTGIVLDLTIHPTVGGYERNLWPLEIAYHVVMAIAFFSITALAWKLALTFRARRKAHA